MRILAEGKEYNQQSLSIYGAYNEGVKKHTFKVSPTAISLKEKELGKLHPTEMKKIEVKVTGANGKVFTYKLGELKKESKADPVVPDEKREKSSSSNKDNDKTKDDEGGIGIFGWSFIVLLVAGIVAGAWFFVRREQLKSEALEKMITDTPELESYD